MSATVTANVTQVVALTVKETVAAGINDPFTVVLPDGSAAVAFSSGTGAKKLSKWAVAAGRVLAASTPETDDLTALNASKYRNNATDFTSTGAKVFWITNLEAVGSGKNLTFSGGASNPFVGKLGGTTPTYTIGPGETLAFVDLTGTGMPVTASIKSFKLDPGANSVTCDVVIAG